MCHFIFFDRIYRIFRISFFWIAFRLPAIASRSGEAGGEESEKTKSTSGGMK